MSTDGYEMPDGTQPDALCSSEADTDHTCAAVTAFIGEEQFPLNVTDLAVDNDERRVQLAELCAQTGTQPIFAIADLLGLSDEARWELLAMIAKLGGECTGPDTESYALFDFVLHQLAGPDDADRCQRGVRAAAEAAALVRGGAVQLACTEIIARLNELGVEGVTFADIKTTLLNIRGGLPGAVPLVMQCLENAPQSAEQLGVPLGWILDEQGIHRPGKDGETLPPVVLEPMAITATLRQTATREESVRLTFRHRGSWRDEDVPRTSIAAAREIVKLARLGVPVTSNNGAQLVEFLAQFEHVNRDVLPRMLLSTQLGWQGENGEQGFLLGKTLLTAGSSADEQHESGSGNGHAEAVIFSGEDGSQQVAASYGTAGRWDGWRAVLGLIESYPRARLALAASLAAPLLMILRTSNFIVEFCGPTSGGKTTVLRLIASVWGNPDDCAEHPAMSTWDGTPTARERTMALRRDLPVIVDDTKRAARPEDISKTIYAVTGGRGRERGTPDGLAASASFRTVMFSSGEARATSFTGDGGTRARVLTLWGSPFGKTDAETADVVRQIREVACAHYGHAGRRFVKYLLAHRAEWESWREDFAERRTAYYQRAGASPFAQRLADYAAVVAVAAHLAHAALELPWGEEDPVADLWPDLAQEASEADRAAAAMEHVLAWSSAHAEEFCSGPKPAGHQPPRGWAGRRDDDELCFYPQTLKEILAAGEFDYDATLSTWRDRGWLKTEEKRLVRHTRINGGNPRLVVINLPAVNAARALDTSSADGDDGSSGPPTPPDGGDRPPGQPRFQWPPEPDDVPPPMLVQVVEE